jgi:hypothetical protein
MLGDATTRDGAVPKAVITLVVVVGCCRRMTDSVVVQEK